MMFLEKACSACVIVKVLSRNVCGAILLLALGQGFVEEALAQQVVSILPSVGVSTNISSSIGSTGVWQQLWAAQPIGSAAPRKGCLVINTSVTRQWVFFGAVPTVGSAIPLEAATGATGAGGSVACFSGGVTRQDQVWITGTTAATFFADSQ